MKNNIEILNNINSHLNEELKIDNVNINNKLYYDIVSQYGVTEKLNNIIDDFQDTIEYKNNNSSLFQKVNLKIGIICDEFLYYSLKDSTNLIYIPYNENLTVDESLDIFLVVTSWRGVDNSWDYIANPSGTKRKELHRLIQEYKKYGTPTVFYSKEDPVSYDEYLSIAKECEYIFTSAEEMIDKYKNDTGNKNVDTLDFGINVSYHNPIGKNLDDTFLSKQVTFAGSWMQRFPKRNAVALKLFEGVKKTKFDLSIIDRQYERKMERYHYPSYLLRNVSATIPHNRLMSLHKATLWGINLNSVTDSMTMFANRIYELQGMGNIILSNYNEGVHHNFPNVNIVYTKDDVQETLNSMSFNEIKHSVATGIRNVMFNHTAFHRLSKVVQRLGYDYQLKLPRILVIGHGENSKASYLQQIYNNLAYIDRVEFENNPNMLSEYDFITEFEEEYIYHEYYVQNLLSAFVYTNADIVQMDYNFYNYIKSEESCTNHRLYKVDSYNQSEGKIIFNIPKTEVNVEYKQSVTKDNTESLITFVIPIDNNNIDKLSYKALSSLKILSKQINISIILLCEEKITIDNRKLINRVFRDFESIQIISPETEFYQEKINNVIAEIATEYTAFLNPENELIIKNYRKLITLLTNAPDKEMIIGQSINYEDKQKICNNFSDVILDKNFHKNNYLNVAIFKVNYLLANNIKVDNNNIKNSLLIFELVKNIKTFTSSSEIVLKNHTFNLNNNYTLSSNEKLNEFLEIETHKKMLLKDKKTHDDYINNVFPEIFLEEYLPVFKSLNLTEKTIGLQTLKSIIDLNIKDYLYGNEKFNLILDLIFNYSE